MNAGTLVKLDGPFTDANANPVSVSAANPRPASGGTDRQTIAQIEALAPESIRVLNRTVSREDFEINARRLPEVARALMLTSNEDAGIAENTGVLFVVPRSGGSPSQSLKDAVRDQVTVVYPSTRAGILAALGDFFAVSLANGTPNPNIDFGFNVKDARATRPGRSPSRTSSTPFAT